ncbi:SCO family protein [Bacillus sp. Marseille-P3661]|uniref:SCO family protein n=1 Tax=Bacillus sp. Marseille-P3661 TaxID=1936234 RepID=UPI0021552324|nr:SCO family protein [Bacillus sp. Marseille-P3661]
MPKISLLLNMCITVIGTALLFFGTNHFQAFTAEQARRIDILNHTPQLENVTFEDSKGVFTTLGDYKGKYIIATFVYTSCGDICPIVESNLQEIYLSLPEHILGEIIQILSISFDPDRDTPHHLEHYRQLFKADGQSWKMVRIPDRQELRVLLEQTGVVVIPTETGYEHNAAFYLINPEGQLIRIFNYDAPEKITKEVKQMLSI